MSDLQKYKKNQLLDPEFKVEYERTRPDFEIMHAAQSNGIIDQLIFKYTIKIPEIA